MVKPLGQVTIPIFSARLSKEGYGRVISETSAGDGFRDVLIEGPDGILVQITIDNESLKGDFQTLDMKGLRRA